MTDILIPVSPGELIDKIGILRLKAERMQSREKLLNVRSELEQLEAAWVQNVPETGALTAATERLFEVNSELWDVEDALRAHERRNDFADEFVRLARSVYVLNDERAALKRFINEHLGSSIVEEKSYETEK